jgi:hypothetical protein
MIFSLPLCLAASYLGNGHCAREVHPALFTLKEPDMSTPLDPTQIPIEPDPDELLDPDAPPNPDDPDLPDGPNSATPLAPADPRNGAPRM